MPLKKVQKKTLMAVGAVALIGAVVGLAIKRSTAGQFTWHYQVVDPDTGHQIVGAKVTYAGTTSTADQNGNGIINTSATQGPLIVQAPGYQTYSGKTVVSPGYGATYYLHRTTVF